MRATRLRAVTVAFAAGGLVIGASSAVPALGDRSATIRSYGTSSPALGVLASLTGAALFAAATLLAADGARARAALATFVLGAAWSADVWAGWAGAPAPLRNAGMLLVPMVAPAALLVVGAALVHGRAAYVAVATAGSGLAAALVLGLVRDPFLDRYCWRDCRADSPAPFSGAELARAATDVSLAVGALCGAVAVVLCAAGVLRRSGTWPLVAGAASGCAVLVSNLVLRLAPAENPARPLYASLFAARAIAFAALALSLGYLAVRPRLVSRAIARLAADQQRSPGGLAAGVAAAVGDPQLRVGYPLPHAGPTVDAEGRPFAFEGEPARIVRGGELIALVGSAAGPPPAAALERALGPAARLALANERLGAEQIFRLDELTELRRRIVATGDAARRRLERDLHDGAQQRLLALSIDLRVALKRAESAGRLEAAALLREAADRVAEATAELRNVAHGLFPSTLANAGLAVALESLADERPLLLSIELGAARRFPASIENAAYAIVAEGTAGASEPVRVRVEERASGLLLTLDGAARNGGGVSAEERVGAAGGSVTRTGRRLEAVLPVPPPS